MPTTLARRARALAVAVLAVVAVAAGCSSEGEDAGPTTTLWQGTIRPTTSYTNPPNAPQGSETEADYTDAFITSFRAGPSPLFTGIDIECVAPKWVAAIGRDSFFAAGVSPEDIATNRAGLERLVGDEGTAGAIVDAIPACGMPLVDLFVEGVGAAGDPERADCLRRELTEDEVRGALVASILQAEGPSAMELAAPCGG